MRAFPPVLDVEALRAVAQDVDVRVVDVRWRLGDPLAGKAAYDKGHIPGAVFADLDKDLAAAPGDRGRHPLPSAETFTGAMARLGVGDGTRVVAYDDQGGAIAARLWFLLRYYGHDQASVLDGGIEAWTTAGLALTTDVIAPSASLFHPRPRPELIIGRDGLQSALDGGALLLDARAPERYRGDVEPVDPRAGHIPGADSAPFQENLAAGRFRDAAALRERYDALGASTRPTIVYCGSGVTACHDLLAMVVAGLPQARLYPGSWSEWSRDPAAPVAIGPTAEGDVTRR
jgi:thiosulfate/3-mercaptopyruvate sulfurtransferase